MTDRDFLRTFRNDFPALKYKRRGKNPVYLDNACTTMVPRQVIDAINQYYKKYPGCDGRRSGHWFADEVSRRINGDPDKGIVGSRQLIADFINAKSSNEIIFTLNTSYAINIVSLGYRFKPGDTVLLTDKEHNSNLIPWLRLQKAGLIDVDYMKPAGGDIFDLEAYRKKLKSGRVRLVSMAYTSNLTGYTLPVKEIVQLAHDQGVKVMLDGAQAVPHHPVDVQSLGVDFLAFSLHKMCGPMGVGVLYAREELLGWKKDTKTGSSDILEPSIVGGGTVSDTTYDSFKFLDSPERFETGIQDYAGIIASGAAVSYLQKIDIKKIQRHETALNTFLTDELLKSYGRSGWFRIIGPDNVSLRSGILTFEVKRPNAVGIARELSDLSNIMIREGVFCAHSFFNKEFGVNWMSPSLPSEHHMVYRVSFYFYNTIEECGIFLDTLDRVFRDRSYIGTGS